jgi:GT2 family glycosyltransferase
MLAEALGVERIPGARRLWGERRLDPVLYGRETPCDWTSGSFMIARRETLAATGGFDERFFLFAEETDLCWRVKNAGWQVMHMPQLTIRHFEHGSGLSSRLEAQAAYARMQFARKHFSRVSGYRLALALRYALRTSLYTLRGGRQSGREQAARAALVTVLDDQPPFGDLTAVLPSGDDRQSAGVGA